MVAKGERCMREAVMEAFAVHDRQRAEFDALVKRNFCDGQCPDTTRNCSQCAAVVALAT